MEDDSSSFYVVRKGDMIGIFKTLNECQAQVSTVCDPPVSVYKGHALSKEAENHLASQGLKSATYVISAAHMKSDLFGSLIPCRFQQPDGVISSVSKEFENFPSKRSLLDLELDGNDELVGSSSISTVPSKRPAMSGDLSVARPPVSKCLSCVLLFDGASKGNPGKAGAGAILRAEDGSMFWRLREGVGIATNNVAEYRALILGLRIALQKGFKNIHVRGDSKLVCMQMQGLWQTKHQDMIELCNVAKGLKKEFSSFQINHVDREFNSEADAQANLAIHLGNGEVKEEVIYK